MLTNLLDGWFKYDVGEGAFMAVFGLLFVVVGITLLVLIFAALGKIMSAVNKKKAKKAELSEKPERTVSEKAEEGISPEIVAVISAAVSAYYEGENVPCDFVVRRIKKL